MSGGGGGEEGEKEEGEEEKLSCKLIQPSIVLFAFFSIFQPSRVYRKTEVIGNAIVLCIFMNGRVRV